MSQQRNFFLYAMVAVLLAAFTLAARQLNADNLWLDELYSLSNMGVFQEPFSLHQVVDSLAAHSQNHVPLYFFLGAQWARLVGWAPFPMRYLALLFGLLLIAWTYRFAADAADRRAGLAAALLLGASGFALFYFHEIRMYSLLLWLGVAHAWFYWRLTSRDSAGGRDWLCFVATAGALLYTHVFSVFVFVGLGLRHLLFAASVRRWYRVFLAWLLGAATFLPFLPHFLRGAMEERTITSLQEQALGASALLPELAHIAVNGVDLLWLPLLLFAALGLWRRRHPMALPLLVICAGIVLSIIAFNEAFPLIDRLRFRFFLPAAPFFAMFCAKILLAVERLRALALAFALVWIAGGLQIYSLGDGWAYSGRNTLFVDIPPLHQYADALQSRTKSLDTIVGFSRSKFVDWTLRHGKSIADYYFGALLRRDHLFIPSADESAAAEYKAMIAAGGPYLLLTYDPRDEPPVFDPFVAALNAEYAACDVLADEASLRIQRYVYAALACDREYAPIHYENGIRILDKFAVYSRERASVRVVTGWEVADEAQLQQYNVSIQILTPDWRKVAQSADRHLYHDVLKWYRVDIPTGDLPPGDYRAVVILYDRYSGDKINGTDLASGETGAILPIARFTVEASAAAGPD